MFFNNNRRFNSYVGYFRETFGYRLQKIVIDAGFTCPNRDGSITRGGCTYCNNDAFHPSYSCNTKGITRQIEEGIEFHKKRYRNAEFYLAYFQTYSNTYAPVEHLKTIYEQALSHPLVKGIVVGTRPDCIDNQKLNLLKELSVNNIVIIEYGIESVFDTTLERINRGHDYNTAKEAVLQTHKAGIHQGAHFIFGLPGETRLQMLDYASEINSLPLNSVKFHQLQIIKGTPMEREFHESPSEFVSWTINEYIDFFIDFLELLKPDVYIERFAGEVPPRFVNFNPWGKIRNVELIRMLEKRLEERETFQSRLYSK